MTSIFDGLGTAMMGVFGQTVTVVPPAGLPRTINAAFREGPEMYVDDEGFERQTVLPTLSGLASDLADIVPGGTIYPGNGNSYRAEAAMPSGSPAIDALVKVRLTRKDVHA